VVGTLLRDTNIKTLCEKLYEKIQAKEDGVKASILSLANQKMN
jgi:hypothetical protein